MKVFGTVKKIIHQENDPKLGKTSYVEIGYQDPADGLLGFIRVSLSLEQGKEGVAINDKVTIQVDL